MSWREHPARPEGARSATTPTAAFSSRSITSRAPIAALFSLGLCVTALTSSSAMAQSASLSSLPDPAKCIVVVDDAGDVGLKISDAQAAHEAVVTALRKRLGTDAVVYEGLQKNAAKMKKMLGGSSETTLQDDQLAYFAAAAKAAPWRVRVRFGSKKGEHWITVGCRKAADKPTTPADEKRVTGKTFADARTSLDAVLPTFCPLLPAAVDSAPKPQLAPGEIPGLRKKVLKPWTPPPKRN